MAKARCHIPAQMQCLTDQRSHQKSGVPYRSSAAPLQGLPFPQAWSSDTADTRRKHCRLLGSSSLHRRHSKALPWDKAGCVSMRLRNNYYLIWHRPDLEIPKNTLKVIGIAVWDREFYLALFSNRRVPQRGWTKAIDTQAVSVDAPNTSIARRHRHLSHGERSPVQQLFAIMRRCACNTCLTLVLNCC